MWGADGRLPFWCMHAQCCPGPAGRLSTALTGLCRANPSHRAGAWEGSGAEDETHSTLSLCRSLNLKEMEPNHTGLHSPCFSSES